MKKNGASLSWVPALRKASGPLYLAIADEIAADIAAGRLQDGARLPPQRALAAALSIDFTTISRAYNEARRRGLIEGRVGQGTYVRARRGSAGGSSSGGLVDMSMNLPPLFDDPALATRMWDDIGALQDEQGLGLLMRYQAAGGARRDRVAGANWLKPRLGDIPADRVLVCPGAQGALLATLSVLAAGGGSICAEALTYPGLRSLAAHLGIEVLGVAMDEKGLLPDAFEAVCLARRPKALYCNPTLHNPTSATLPLERREAIVAIARRHGVAIIEDDAYGALPASPLPPLAALAPDLVYHVAGLAKCLSPALRIAYLVVPDPRGPFASRARFAPPPEWPRRFRRQLPRAGSRMVRRRRCSPPFAPKPACASRSRPRACPQLTSLLIARAFTSGSSCRLSGRAASSRPGCGQPESPSSQAMPSRFLLRPRRCG